MQSFALAAFAVAALAALPALADKLPLPQAAYSADATFEARGRVLSGHINVDGAKERREVKNASGIPTITIIRRDLGKVYDVRLKRNLVVALRMAAAEAAGETGAPGIDVDSFYGTEATMEGADTVSGLETKKYHIKIDGGPDLTVDAVVWATDDGIIVRVVGNTSIDSDSPPSRMELKNIVRGPQDAALFEIPKGISVLSPSSEGDSTESPPAGATAPPAAH